MYVRECIYVEEKLKTVRLFVEKLLSWERAFLLSLSPYVGSRMYGMVC